MLSFELFQVNGMLDISLPMCGCHARNDGWSSIDNNVYKIILPAGCFRAQTEKMCFTVTSLGLVLVAAALHCLNFVCVYGCNRPMPCTFNKERLSAGEGTLV